MWRTLCGKQTEATVTGCSIDWVFCEKGILENFANEGLLLKRHFKTGVFMWNICEFFKNEYFEEHLRMTDSVYNSSSEKFCKTHRIYFTEHLSITSLKRYPTKLLDIIANGISKRHQGINHLIRWQNFPKEKNISYSLIRKRTCVYQSVRNVSS